MTFSHPIWFALLIAIPVAWLFCARRANRPPRLAVAVSYMACITVAIFALVEPIIQTPTKPAALTVALVDVSDTASDGSIAAARQQIYQNPTWKVIVFSNRVLKLDGTDELSIGPRLTALRTKLARPLYDGDSESGGAALADAIQLAGSMMPVGDTGKVVVFSDGRQTRGDAAAAAVHLARRGIFVLGQAGSPVLKRPFILDAPELPASTGIGQTFELRVKIKSPSNLRASIDCLFENNRIAGVVDTPIQAGENTVDIPVSLQKAGLNQVQVRMTASGQTQEQTASCQVTPPRRVIVIESPGRGTATALQALLGNAAAVKTVTPDRFASEETDLLVIGDMPASDLPETSQQSISQAVKNGMGLVFTGGAHAFGSGGWASSSLADLMPIRMPQTLQQKDPSTAVVFVIDTSGSMKGTAITLAKQIARSTLQRLQPQDKAGIVEFYGSKRWAAPMQSVSNKLDLDRALNRLSAEGGTVILPAIVEAEFALKNVTTRTRHVVLFTDGGVENAPYETVVRRMASEGVTLSTVLVAKDSAPILQSMAEWGHGKFYRVSDAFNLPELIFHQPQVDMPPPVELAPTHLLPSRAGSITSGIDFTSAPALKGYVRVEPKPTADVMLQSDRGDALLTSWRYGRGRVTVLPTQLGSQWTADLSGWAGTAKLTSNLCRSMYAVPASASIALTPMIRPAGLEIAAKAMVEHRGLYEGPLTLRISRAGKIMAQQILDPFQKGCWDGLFTGLTPGTYEIYGSCGSHSGSSAITLPDCATARAYTPNLELFKSFDQIGSRIPMSETQDASTVPLFIDLTRPLIGLAMVLFLVHIWTRRLPNQVPGRSRTLPAQSTEPAAQLMVTVSLLVLMSFPVWCKADAIPTTLPAEASAIIPLTSSLQNRVEQNPDDADAWATLAETQELMGDQQSAINSLDRAIKTTAELPKKTGLQLLLATQLFDVGKAEQACALMSNISTTGDADAKRSIMILAALYNQPELAARFAASSPDSDLNMEMLRGGCLMQAKQPAAAQACFDHALPLAIQPRDRRFVLERIVAAARSNGTLSTLADRWLRDPTLPADCQLLLVGILRELNRIDDLMMLWRRNPESSAKVDALISDELLAATLAAGRLNDAENIARGSLAGDPGSPGRLSNLVKILIQENRGAEADGILLTASKETGTPQRALEVAQLSKNAGRYDVASRIALGCEHFGGDQAIAGLLLAAAIERTNGLPTNDLLHRATVLAGEDPQRLAAVADCYDELGNLPNAIALQTRAVKNSPGFDDARRRLAWMLERNGQLADALTHWRELWKTAKESEPAQDAKSHLLDLSARIGVASQLMQALEAKAKAREANTRELQMLVDLYIQKKDASEAARILQSNVDLFGGLIGVQRRLSHVYVECGRLDLADQAFHELLKSDPANAEDTLQSLAILSVQRGSSTDARWAIDQLVSKIGADGGAAAELLAGVFSQMQQYADAAAQYRRAVELNPDQSEDWILWAGMMVKANRGKEAEQQMLLLTSRPVDDNTFAIGIDSLLNLRAPTSVLLAARRLALARLCGSGGRKLFLYGLIRDLCDEVKDPGFATRSLELSLVYAGEQRTELLRDLISATLADKSASSAEQLVAQEQMLLGLADHVPPQDFILIGDKLLSADRLPEASAAYRRAIEETEIDDSAGVRKTIARSYQNAGKLTLAFQMLQPALSYAGDDLELHEQAASVLEQLNRLDEAFDQYLVGVKQVIAEGQIHWAVAALSLSTQNAVSISVAQEDAEGFVSSAIATARRPQDRERLVQLILDAARQSASENGGVTVSSTCGDLACLLRRVCFAFHAPDAADQFDREMIKQCQADKDFATAAFADRIKWGLYDRAIQVASSCGLNLPTPLQWVVNQVPDSARIETNSEVHQAVEWIPRLLIQGKQAEAEKRWAHLARTAPDSVEVYPALMVISMELHDSQSAAVWGSAWLNRAVTDASAALVAGQKVPWRPESEMTRCVRMSWPALSDQGRVALTESLHNYAEHADLTSVRNELLSLYMQAAKAVGQEPGVETIVPENKTNRRQMSGSTAAGGLSFTVSTVPGLSQARLAVSTITPAEAAAHLACLTDPSKDQLTRVALLDHLGRPNEALQILQQLLKDQPQIPNLKELVTERLAGEGRYAEVLDRLTDQSETNLKNGGSGLMQLALGQLGFVDRLVVQRGVPEWNALPLSIGVTRQDDRILPLLRNEEILSRFSHHPLIIYISKPLDRKGIPSPEDNQWIWADPWQRVASQNWAADELGSIVSSSNPAEFTLPWICEAFAFMSPGQQHGVQQILEQAAVDRTLTSCDRLIVTQLMKHGFKPSTALLKAWTQLECAASPMDLQTQHEMAEAQQAAGIGDSNLDRWVFSARAILGSASLHRNVGRFTPPAAPESDDGLDLAQLKLLAPVPGEGPVDDASEAIRLKKMSELNPAAAEDALKDDRRRGLVPANSYSQVGIIAARLAILRAKHEEFRKDLLAAIKAGLTQSTNIITNLPDVVPTTFDNADRQTVIDDTLSCVRECVGAAPSLNANASRSSCLLGYWCVEHDLGESANSCLQTAEQLAAYSGEHQLWWADLARKMGQTRHADEIELRMLSDRSLPLLRIAPLLVSMKMDGSGDVGSAEKKANYCNWREVTSVTPSP